MNMSSLAITHQEHMTKEDAKNRMEEEKSYPVIFGGGHNNVSAQCKTHSFQLS